MNKASDTLWFMDHKHPIVLTSWDEALPSPEVIAYHTATGDTHLLTAEGATILKILQSEKRPFSASEVTERFRTAINAGDSDFDSTDIVNAFLTPFSHLELIEEIHQ